MSRRVCVIGAGSSGIAVAKVLKEHGIPFDCYERGSGIGGNWRYDNDNEMSSAYASLHINTSKTLMAYSDYPMPDEYPDFPGHAAILAYFEDYVDHFGIRDSIQFETGVDAVEPDGDRWRVRTDAGAEEIYDAVIVANGHHWHPRWPDFPGELDGEVLHSHYYRTPGFLTGKRVLVVGIGNSAVDIASEACRVADATYLSTRRSAHVVPKYIFGKPADTLVDPKLSAMPLVLQRKILEALLVVARGRQESYGVPVPDFPITAAHPTISDELLHLVGHGRVTMKPNVDRLDGPRVVFVDGSAEDVDVVIYCTGYDIRFPFLSDDLAPVDDNRIRLYCRVVPPDRTSLYFVGLVQPLGAIMPIAEKQAHWIAGLLSGELKLPDRATMDAEIDAYERELSKRYVASARHTIQVDFHPYLAQLKREMKRARKR